MATIEERVTTLETEFRTELRHLATKADLADLRAELSAKIDGMLWKFASISVGVGALIVAILRIWQ